jgi:UDP-N-acetylglucosamine 2-epimerase (non-hydrolysing)
MTSIVLCFGTRPEAIKLGPVAHELRVLGVRPTLICSGQHTQLLAGTPAETDLAEARSLGLASTGNVTRWLASAEAPLKSALGETKDAVVVVQGDTMSALAAARAASDLGIVVAHVEAGVRSWNDEEPWPEERFRRDITGLADWHYAPTSECFANLVREGVSMTRILVTGNTVVSALARYSEAKPVAAAQERTVLVTLHRRELLLDPELLRTLQALAFACAHAEDVRFLWPLHPAMQHAVQQIGWPANVHFVAPLAYRACVEGLARCIGVLTDSGGLQEEAATLGVPCAVVRNVTDRPESVAAGIARVFSPTPAGVDNAVACLAEEKLPRLALPVFGTPKAAAEVARHLAKLVVDD